jgi:hypothetical protein
MTTDEAVDTRGAGAAPSPPPPSPAVVVTKMTGGGASWFYAVGSDGKVLGASHEDDAEGMKALRDLQKRKQQEAV